LLDQGDVLDEEFQKALAETLVFRGEPAEVEEIPESPIGQ
jgi:hypothetical protein